MDGPRYVMAVQGNVVYVHFEARLPPLRQKLVTTEPGPVVMEAASHLDARTVRCIALTPTRGLALGATVVDTGGPLEVPVGESLLGRMLNRAGHRRRTAAGGSRVAVDPPPVGAAGPAHDPLRDLRDRYQGDRPPEPARAGRQGRALWWRRVGTASFVGSASAAGRRKSSTATSGAPAFSTGRLWSSGR